MARLYEEDSVAEGDGIRLAAYVISNGLRPGAENQSFLAQV